MIQTHKPTHPQTHTGTRIHRSPTENSAADFSTVKFGGLGLWLTVGVLGSVNPNRYTYPNPNNNPNANPTLTLIVTLTPNLPLL